MIIYYNNYKLTSITIFPSIPLLVFLATLRQKKSGRRVAKSGISWPQLSIWLILNFTAVLYLFHRYNIEGNTLESGPGPRYRLRSTNRLYWIQKSFKIFMFFLIQNVDWKFTVDVVDLLPVVKYPLVYSYKWVRKFFTNVLWLYYKTWRFEPSIFGVGLFGCVDGFFTVFHELVQHIPELWLFMTRGAIVTLLS